MSRLDTHDIFHSKGTDSEMHAPQRQRPRRQAQQALHQHVLPRVMLLTLLLVPTGSRRSRHPGGGREAEYSSRTDTHKQGN